MKKTFEQEVAEGAEVGKGEREKCREVFTVELDRLFLNGGFWEKFPVSYQGRRI